MIRAIATLPSSLENLILESEREGFSFVRRLKTKWDDETNRFDKAGEFFMFDEMLAAAKSKLREQQFSGRISCGQVSAAIETSTGNLYTGVCIDTSCALGMCAERNAIGSMVTEGEFHVTKLACLGTSGLLVPCGACLELLMQLHPDNADLQVLVDSGGQTAALRELLPQWWGSVR